MGELGELRGVLELDLGALETNGVQPNICNLKAA